MLHIPIETFNEGILIKLVYLNIPERAPTNRTIGRNTIGEGFWVMIEPHGLRLAVQDRHMLQHRITRSMGKEVSTR
jgi:hypothetical protein